MPTLTTTLIDDDTLAAISSADSPSRAAAMWWAAWLQANNPDVGVFGDRFTESLYGLLCSARYGSFTLTAHDKDPDKIIESYRRSFVDRLLEDALHAFGIVYDRDSLAYALDGRTLNFGFVSMGITITTVTVATNTDDENVVWHQPEGAA